MKRILNGVILLAVFYVGVIALLYVYQRNLLYLPSGEYESPEALGLKGVEEATLTADDGTQLISWHYAGEENAPYIVFFHGNAAPLISNHFFMEMFRAQGFNLMAVEYRGYPGNSGEPTEQGLYQDARANIDYVKEQYGAPESNIIIMGHSLGTGVATQMATEYQSRALVLLAPFDSIIEMAKRRYLLIGARYLVKDAFDSIAKIGGIQQPVIIYHGDADMIVPLSHGKQLYEAANEHTREMTVQTGRGHNDLDFHTIAAELAARFK